MSTSWCFNTGSSCTLWKWETKLSQAQQPPVLGLSWFVTSFLLLTTQLCNIFIALSYDTPLSIDFLCVHVCFLYFKVNTILSTFSCSCQDSLNLMAECEIRLAIRGSGVQWFEPLIICFVNTASNASRIFFVSIELKSGERICFTDSAPQSDFPARCCVNIPYFLLRNHVCIGTLLVHSHHYGTTNSLLSSLQGGHVLAVCDESNRAPYELQTSWFRLLLYKMRIITYFASKWCCMAKYITEQEIRKYCSHN